MSVCGYNELMRRLTVDVSDQDRLVVTPLMHITQVQSAAIDLRMGNVVLLVRSRGLSHVDPRHYVKGQDRTFSDKTNKQQKFQRHDIPFGQSFLLHPGTLALVPTFEWVRLPLNSFHLLFAKVNYW